MPVFAQDVLGEGVTRIRRMPMRLPFIRNELDQWIRRWLFSNRTDSRCWEQIEAVVYARARARARRYQFSPADGEDRIGEVFLHLLVLLEACDPASIRDFDAYIGCVIENVFKTHIRRSKPVWTLLKDEIVETLRGRRGATGFALWKGSPEALAGYAIWEGAHVRATSRYLQLQEDARPLREHVQAQGRPEAMELPALLAAVFNWLGTPLPVGELTSLVFDLRGLQERLYVPVDSLDRSSDPVADAAAALMTAELLQTIAAAFRQLPRSESTAFLFHLQPEVAERLVAQALPNDGSAEDALARLAGHLDMPENDLKRALEEEIPWDDLHIAAFLSLERETRRLTQQAVINLRQRALQLLRRSIEAASIPAAIPASSTSLHATKRGTERKS